MGQESRALVALRRCSLLFTFFLATLLAACGSGGGGGNTTQLGAPVIQTAPSSQSVSEGETAVFTVVATGTGPLAYQWQRNGVNIPGATTPVYVTPVVGVGDSGGQYTVIVTNPVGGSTAGPATLTVKPAVGAPILLRFPAVGVGAVGQRVIVTATVAGSPPFNYEWLRDGQRISGASGSSDTNTITHRTPILTGADDGASYSLNVTNAFGTVTSGVAIIRVILPSQVAAGAAHTLARNRNGSAAYAWGDNQYGQLGLGTTSSNSAPAVIPGLSNVIALAAGADHSLALTSQGTVYAWGRNAFGALGDGTQINRSTPQLVPGLTGVVAIAAGNGRSFALRNNGTLMAWGENGGGALGIGTNAHALAPTQIGAGLSGFDNLVAVAAGDRHTLALRSDGAVFGWGQDDAGQLGGSGNRNAPAVVAGVSNIAAIAAGTDFSLTLDLNARLWSWGSNGAGQLGTTSSAASGTPAQITTTRSGDTMPPIVAISAGARHALALSYQGAAYAWGSDSAGQLGDGSASTGANAPSPISGTFNVRSLAGGGAHSAAALTDGSVITWGSNSAGQLGIGSSDASRTTPSQVPALNLN